MKTLDEIENDDGCIAFLVDTDDCMTMMIILMMIAKKIVSDIEYEFQTYNVGLLNNELGPNNVDRITRRDRITSAVQQSTADVLCLQGVWYEVDIHHVSLFLSLLILIH